MTTVYLVINVIIFYISGSSGEKLRKCLFCFKQQTEHSRFMGNTVTTEYRVSLLFLTALCRVPDLVTQALVSYTTLPYSGKQRLLPLLGLCACLSSYLRVFIQSNIKHTTRSSLALLGPWSPCSCPVLSLL